VQIADFNGDGRFDVVYRDDQTGLVQVLLTATNGVSASSVNTYITVSNLAWKIVPYLPSALGATAMEVVIPIGNG
jgi:glycogen synthase